VEKHKLREKKKSEAEASKTEGGTPSSLASEKAERESKNITKERVRGRSPPSKDWGRSPPQRPRSPVKRRSRTPSPRTRAKERQEREATRREKEKEESLREEESYEARQLQRKQRAREKAYKERLTMWESRERRKAKEYDKDYEKEEQRKEEMEKEGKDLAEFLEDYDDEKDDQRYYKGSQFARRRRERELEREEDERDRQREKEEIEALRLEVMERQIKENKRQEGIEDGGGSTGSSSPQREEEEDEEDDDIPKVEEMDTDIPLAKAGFNPIPSYPPIKVQSAPSVDLKSHPRDSTEGDGIMFSHTDGVTEVEDMEPDSPLAGVKMSFGVRGKVGSGVTGGGGSNGTPLGKRTTMDTNVLGADEEGEINAPKKKLASIKQIEKEQRDERRGALEREVSEMAAKYSGDDKRIPPDEKKKMIQTLVKGIPTTKEELFEYELKWDAIDQVRGGLLYLKHNIDRQLMCIIEFSKV
jgi:RNA-binding protein 25